MKEAKDELRDALDELWDAIAAAIDPVLDWLVAHSRITYVLAALLILGALALLIVAP